MSTTTAPPPGAPAPAGPARDLPRAGLGAAMRSEWIKIRTLRSTYITLILTVVISVGLGAAIAAAVGNAVQNGKFTGVLDPTAVSYYGLTLGQLALVVLGTMVVTSEYSTGMIRTSLSAVPKRGRFFAAKATVFTIVALVVGEITSFLCFFVAQAVLSGYGPHASLGQHDVLRAVFGAGMFLALIGLISLAVGAILRNTAATIAVMVALVFVLPGVSNALPSSIGDPIRKYWPSEAGRQILLIHRTSNTLAAWAGLGVMALFTAVLLAVAAVLLVSRDA